MNSKRKANRESGIAASYIVLAVVAVTLASAATFYLLTPTKAPVSNENYEVPIRHLANSSTGESNVGTDVGKTAPNFVDTDDNSFSLVSLRGKVVVLDFMASWCSPCITEMSHLKEIFSSYSADQLVIISIDVDPTESDDAIKQFRSTYGDNWVFASGSGVGTTYVAIYIPTLYLIDKQGAIAYKGVGVTSSSTLSTEINKLL